MPKLTVRKLSQTDGRHTRTVEIERCKRGIRELEEVLVQLATLRADVERELAEDRAQLGLLTRLNDAVPCFCSCNASPMRFNNVEVKRV